VVLWVMTLCSDVVVEHQRIVGPCCLHLQVGVNGPGKGKPFTEPEGSLPCSQNPDTGPYPGADESRPHLSNKLTNINQLFGTY